MISFADVKLRPRPILVNKSGKCIKKDKRGEERDRLGARSRDENVHKRQRRALVPSPRLTSAVAYRLKDDLENAALDTVFSLSIEKEAQVALKGRMADHE